MSTEYPPIIIDGTNFYEQPPTEGTIQSVAAVEYQADDSGPKITIDASLVSLYLIRDNQLIHQGDYKSEQIKLIWGEKAEEAMAVGGSSMTIPAASLQELDSGSTRIVRKGARRVTKIQVPTQRDPLVLGRDFHNFLIIVQRRG